MASPDEILVALTLACSGSGANLAAACAMLPAGDRDRLRTFLLDSAIEESMTSNPPGPPGPPAKPAPQSGDAGGGSDAQPDIATENATAKPAKLPPPGWKKAAPPVLHPVTLPDEGRKSTGMAIPAPPFTGGGVNKMRYIYPEPPAKIVDHPAEHGAGPTSTGPAPSGTMTSGAAFLQPEHAVGPAQAFLPAGKKHAPVPGGKPPPAGFEGAAAEAPPKPKPVAPSTGEAPEVEIPEAPGRVFKHPPPAHQSASDGATGMSPAASFPPPLPAGWGAYTGGASPPPPPGPWPGRSSSVSARRDRRDALARSSRAGLQLPAGRDRVPMADRDPTRPESPEERLRRWWFPSLVELRAWEELQDRPVELFRRRCPHPELAYCFVGSLPAGTPYQPLDGNLPDELDFIGWCGMPCPRPSNSGSCLTRCFRPVYQGSHRSHGEHVCSGCRGYRGRR